MKQNDEVIYSISISGINKLDDQSAIVKELPTYIGAGKMQVTPVMKSTPGTVTIPRLFTSWRGDTEEQAWQSRLIEAVKGFGASIAIDVQAWSHAPGYPQGDTEL